MAKAKQLPSGNWRVQAKITIDGKTIVRSFTASSSDKAEALALQWQKLTREENRIENITLSQAIKNYIEIKKNILSPSTIREYKRISDKYFASIINSRIATLTQEQIQRAINIESATHSPKTVRNLFGLIMTVLNMYRPDFVIHISLPQKKPTNMYIPDDTDIKRLMAAVKGKNLEIPVLLAAFGPMRRGEICALTSDDIKGNTVTVSKAMVYTDDKTWIIKSPKTVSSYRTIEYPDFVIERLSGISGRISPLLPSSITNSFNKILAENNIPHFRFHDLRHYAVSIMHAMNVPDKYIMARGGWQTNYTMNNVYNHALKNKQTEFDNKISAHFEDLYNSDK